MCGRGEHGNRASIFIVCSMNAPTQTASQCGMPCGSTGMGAELQREAHVVYLIRRDGTTATYSNYQAA